MRILFALGLFMCGCAAHASDWQQQAGIAARLLIGKTDDGYWAGFDIKPDKGWYSYWLYAGASGFPPQFDLSQSDNLGVDRVRFPAPHFTDDGLGGYYGYYDQFGLPFKINIKDKAQKADIHAQLTLGACNDKICVPFSFTFHRSFMLDDIKTNTRLTEIIAALPQNVPAKRFIKALKFDGKALHITLKSDELQAPVIMPDFPAAVISGVQSAARYGDDHLITLPIFEGGAALYDENLNFVIRDGAFTAQLTTRLTD